MRNIILSVFVVLALIVVVIAGCKKTAEIDLTGGQIVLPTATNTQVVASPTNTPFAGTATNTPVVSPTFTATTPADTPTASPTATDSGALAALIDDCEDGDNTSVNYYYWYSFDDTTSCNGTPEGAEAWAGCSGCGDGLCGVSYVVPMSDDYAAAHSMSPEDFYMQAPGYNSSSYAARITGYAIGYGYQAEPCILTAHGVDDYGFRYGFVGMGVGLCDPTPCILDVSSFTGIEFYHNGDGKTYRCKLGCSSTAVFPLGESDNMYGHTFVAGGAGGGTWTLFHEPFTDFTQEAGWGNTPANGVQDVIENLESIQFQTTFMGCALGTDQATNGADLWVDDLTFY